MGSVKHRNSTKPSVAMLRACVEYHPKTGAFVWKHRPVEHFTSERAAASWNTRFAGRPVAKTRRGYLIVTITVEQRETHSLAHRAAWALMTGAWPDHEVDHQDRNRTNNAWTNLRACTHLENQFNKGRSSRNNSGFKGVHHHTQNNAWIAQIKHGGKTKHLGSFATAKEAADAYRTASLKHHGQFSSEVP